MTELEKHYTRIIAEFMGYKYFRREHNGGTDYFMLKDYILMYHEMYYIDNYQYLIPVWVKFRNIVNFPSEKVEMIYSEHRAKIAHAILYSSQKEAFTLLGEAIEWYNGLKI